MTIELTALLIQSFLQSTRSLSLFLSFSIASIQFHSGTLQWHCQGSTFTINTTTLYNMTSQSHSITCSSSYVTDKSQRGHKRVKFTPKNKTNLRKNIFPEFQKEPRVECVGQITRLDWISFLSLYLTIVLIHLAFLLCVTCYPNLAHHIN